jgi:hypothetical protein
MRNNLFMHLRPKILLASILLVTAMSTAAQADCWEDSLKSVSRNLLVMDSDAVYRVVPSREMTSVFWLPSAHVTICDSIDDDGHETDYYRIRNWDDAGSVWATRDR